MEKGVFDIYHVLREIQENKRFFSSEVEFQIAIAMQIEKIYGQNSFICEFTPDYMSRIDGKKSRIHIDILFCNENIPIEIKYRTKKAVIYTQYGAGMRYQVALANQGAHDEGSFGFWRDVCRVNEYKKNVKQCKKGYVVFLTNDVWYKEPDYSRCKVSYEEYNLNLCNKAIRNGRISGDGKTLESVPVINSKWLNWEVCSESVSLQYWCYVAEVK